MAVEGRMTFDEFVLARSSALHRTAVLLTGEPHTAHDLLQEALLKAWRSWHRITEQPEGYVRTILLREYLTGRRRRWHGEVPTETIPEHPSRPDTEVEIQLALGDAIRELSPQQRAVIVLRYFHDLTEADTARTLGISVGSAKSHHSRALAALRISSHVDDVVAPHQRRQS